MHCGIGNQPVRWLADVAVHKFDPNYNMTAGRPIGYKMENNAESHFSQSSSNTVADELTDDVHIFLMFREDQLEAAASKASARGGKNGKK